MKLISNFHNPISGLVYRRVTGQADKTARDAPVVGVNYNDLMGGTDLNDWMRGLYTTARIGKKWWKCLFFWCLDASMINAFLLHKWCFKHLHPHKKYIPTFANFIHSVCRELTIELVPGTFRSRHRYIMPMHNAKSTKTTGDDYFGPSGEDRRARADAACGGGELERTPLIVEGKKAGRHHQFNCRYCWNSNSVKKIKKTTSYQCSTCKIPLCPTCVWRYHLWVNS